MFFWVFMVVCDLLIPLSMIFFGRSYQMHPPAAVNNYEGYRTKRSKKSSESREFAHRYWGRMSAVIGAAALPLSIVPFLFVIGREVGVAGIVGGIVCFVQIVLIFVPICATESALKKNFGEEEKSFCNDEPKSETMKLKKN